MASKNSRTAHAKRQRQEIKLNLGCGSHLLPGFINVDLYENHVSNGIAFRQGDIRHLPFESEMADYIVCDNVLEHLPMADIPLALFEIRRVMKSGARCLIMVPDFTFVAKQFLECATGRFNAMVYRWCAEVAYGIQIHEGEFHRTPFCPEYFNFQLHAAGFSKFDMIIFPAGCPMPDAAKFPGIGIDPSEKSFFRNDNILADIRK